MVTTRWNLDQRSRRNPEDSSDIIDIQEETQAWAENLRQSTIDSSIYSAEAKSDLTVQQTWLEYERDIHTLVWFLSVLDKLLEEIKDTKKWISKKWLSKAGKRTMDEAKTKLKQYEDAIKGKKKILLKQKKPEIYDYDIDYFVSSDFYFIVDEDELIGMCELRHNLSKLGQEVKGNINCGIRPSKRNKGYCQNTIQMV